MDMEYGEVLGTKLQVGGTGVLPTVAGGAQRGNAIGTGQEDQIY